MIASKGMMQAILAMYMLDFQNSTRIHLYKGNPPADNILQSSGFIYANHSANLLATLTIPTNSFNMVPVELEKKWRFVFQLGNHAGTFSASGEVNYAVIGDGSTALRASVCSAGDTDSEILRINTKQAVSGQPVIASTFNLVIERNTLL